MNYSADKNGMSKTTNNTSKSDSAEKKSLLTTPYQSLETMRDYLRRHEKEMLRHKKIVEGMNQNPKKKTDADYQVLYQNELDTYYKLEEEQEQLEKEYRQIKQQRMQADDANLMNAKTRVQAAEQRAEELEDEIDVTEIWKGGLLGLMGGDPSSQLSRAYERLPEEYKRAKTDELEAKSDLKEFKDNRYYQNRQEQVERLGEKGWAEVQEAVRLKAELKAAAAGGQPYNSQEAWKRIEEIIQNVEALGGNYEELEEYATRLLNYDQTQLQIQKDTEFAEEHPVIATVGARMTNLATPVGMIGIGAQAAANWGKDPGDKDYVPIDMYDPSMMAYHRTQALSDGALQRIDQSLDKCLADVDQQLESASTDEERRLLQDAKGFLVMMQSKQWFTNGESTAHWVYHTATELADAAIGSFAITGSAGFAVGAVKSSAEKTAIEKAAPYLLDFIVTNREIVQSVTENKKDGLDDWQALSLGVFTGLSSTLVAKVGASKLLKMEKSEINKLIDQFVDGENGKLQKALKEGAYSAVSQVQKAVLKNGFEALIGGNQQELLKGYQDGLRNGKTPEEAWKAALQIETENDGQSLLTFVRKALVAAGKGLLPEKMTDNSETPKMRRVSSNDYKPYDDDPRRHTTTMGYTSAAVDSTEPDERKLRARGNYPKGSVQAGWAGKVDDMLGEVQKGRPLHLTVYDGLGHRKTVTAEFGEDHTGIQNDVQLRPVHSSGRRMELDGIASSLYSAAEGTKKAANGNGSAGGKKQDFYSYTMSNLVLEGENGEEQPAQLQLIVWRRPNGQYVYNYEIQDSQKASDQPRRQV